MRDNATTNVASGAEERLLALRATLGESPLVLSSPTLQSVSEDFVQISIPGYPSSGSSTRASEELTSPMLSVGSSTRGAPRGGGFGKGADGKKFGVVLVLKNSGVCCSDIGDGSKFCLKLNCVVASHKEAKKFDPTDEGSIVIAKGRDVAFASPALGGTILPRSVIEEWQSTAKTLDAWHDLFKASESDSNFSSSAEYEARLRERQLAESYKTPAKKKGQQTSFLLSGLESMSLYAQSVEVREKSSFQLENPGRLSEIVLAVDEGLHSLSKAFAKHVLESQDAISGLEMSDAMLEAHKTSTASLLGSISMMSASSFQSPTIFGTLSAIATTVEDMARAGPPIVDFAPIQAELAKLAADTQGVQKLSIDLTVLLSDKVKSLELWKNGFAGSYLPGAAPQPAPAVAIHTPPTPYVGPVLSAEELSRIMDRLADLEIEKASHQVSIQQLISEADETAIKFCGLGLKSIEETGAWIELNSPHGVFDFAMIPDAYFILEILSGDGESNQTQMLKTLNSLKSLNLSSEYQAKTLCAFQLEVPRYLHGSTDVSSYASGVGESQLKLVPTVESWNVGIGSKKKTLERKLPGIRTVLQSLISNALSRTNEKLHSVANEGLARSIAFITSICSFMDRAFENAHIASRMSRKKSWALVTQLVRRVFAEIFVVRQGTIQAMGIDDPKLMCRAIVWSIFRTHDKMAEFENANFEDHPAIASEHIKFLACNSGFDILESLEKDIVTVQSDSKEAGQKATQAVRKADAATTLADTNKKSIAELSKRVDRKMDK